MSIEQIQKQLKILRRQINNLRLKEQSLTQLLKEKTIPIRVAVLAEKITRQRNFEKKVYEMRMAGKSWESIGLELKISAGSAQRKARNHLRHSGYGGDSQNAEPKNNTADEACQVTSLNLSGRAIHVLRSADVYTIKDLKLVTVSTLMKTPGCGDVTICEIQQMMVGNCIGRILGT